MADEFNTSQPIYHQLVQRICRQIVRGEVQAGSKLPSVREMALTSNVNPNTVQRVYSELERMDVAVSRRGQGTFVTEDAERLKAMRGQLREEQISSFVGDMREMGFSADEILSGLQEHLQGLGAGGTHE
jgi:GntR family transcriptional regulator